MRGGNSLWCNIMNFPYKSNYVADPKNVVIYILKRFIKSVMIFLISSVSNGLMT